MKRDRLISFLHVIGYSAIFVSIVLGFVFTRKGQDAFMDYLKEDGLIENLTALFLLASSGVAIYRLIRAARAGNRLWMLTWILLAILFFFAAGEEISWGQRIFNFEITGFFQKNNLQHETNLHNLVIGGVKINKLVFSQILMVLLVFYFVFLPVLTRKFSFFNRLVRLFDIPVPRWDHVVVMTISIILISQFPYLRSGELNEFAFAIIIFLIFLHPSNPDLRPFSKEKTLLSR